MSDTNSAINAEIRKQSLRRTLIIISALFLFIAFMSFALYMEQKPVLDDEILTGIVESRDGDTLIVRLSGNDTISVALDPERNFSLRRNAIAEFAIETDGSGERQYRFIRYLN